MKNIVFFVLLNFISALSLYAIPKVAVVDVDAVLQRAIIGKAAKASMEQEVKKIRAKFELERGQIMEAEKKLEKQASLLSAQAYGERELELAEKKERFNELLLEGDKTVSKSSAEKISAIMAKIDTIVEELVQEGRFDIVLDRARANVVYVETERDLTDKVINALDKRN